MLFSLIPNFKSTKKIKHERDNGKCCRIAAKIYEISSNKNVQKITPLRIIIRSHFISRALVFLIRLESIEAFSDLSRMKENS